MSLEQKVIHKLIAKRKTLALAESCTGGLLASRLTDVPGSSKCLKFCLVAYTNETKTKFLRVPASTIKKFGAVSEPTAIAMANGAQKQLKSNIGLSITGIAGPTGGTKRKPVGLVYIAINHNNETFCSKYFFKGGRGMIKQHTVKQALALLLKLLV